MATAQRFLLGGHVAVVELVGDDQIGFRPQCDHRLVATPALVVSVRRPLVRFHDGGVLIDGGDAESLAVLLVECGDALHSAGQHLLRPLYRGAAGDDEAELLFASRALLFQRLVVEPFREPAYRVVGEQVDVFRAVPAG